MELRITSISMESYTFLTLILHTLSSFRLMSHRCESNGQTYYFWKWLEVLKKKLMETMTIIGNKWRQCPAKWLLISPRLLCTLLFPPFFILSFIFAIHFWHIDIYHFVTFFYFVLCTGSKSSGGTRLLQNIFIANNDIILQIIWIIRMGRLIADM